jgi:uroporphyrinogen decarboxylase
MTTPRERVLSAIDHRTPDRAPRDFWAEAPTWNRLLSHVGHQDKEDYTRAAEATDGRIDLYLLISDLGSQHGPLISVDMFREFVAPYLREMVVCIHNLGGKVLYHSCGMIQPLIPALIESGIDVLDPIQPVGPGMSPDQLKAEFGDRLCFHGGIDMQHLLRRGSAEEVRKEVRRYCDVLGRGGGYILGPAHLFQPDVPPENILAVYQCLGRRE